MYFVVSDMGEVDPMYQFSLKYFKQLFNNTISTSEKSDDLQTRLDICLEETTVCIYKNVSRGLFEKHKLVFSFLLCSEIMKTEGEITPLEWNFFLRGPIGGIEKQNVPKPENTTWLPLNVWKMACEMSDTFEDFRYIHYDLDKTPVWIRLDEGPEVRANPPPERFLYAVLDPPEYNDGDLPLPDRVNGNWNDRLTAFQKLMLVKVFREERTSFAVTEFVSECLGKQFVESPPVTLPELYESMSKTTPLVFVLSPGSDPMTSFLRFAKDMGVHENVKSISLGQGQGPVADKMIKNATKFGEWVFVQNCHLAASWMNAMEDIIKNIQETSSLLHSNFRLLSVFNACQTFPCQCSSE
nr:dynein heavy chain 6; axonemal [Biomphalaria glabrata]